MNEEQPKIISTGSVVSKGNTNPNITYIRNSNFNNACACQVIRLIQDIDKELNQSDNNSNEYKLRRSLPNMTKTIINLDCDVFAIRTWWEEYREFLFKKFNIRRFDMGDNNNG